MITREEITHIGKFNKTHGISGEISATVSVDLEVIEGCSCIVSDVDGIFAPFFITAVRKKSSETVLLTIDGIDSDIEAQALVGGDIYVLRGDYEAAVGHDDEVPVDFFINFNAVINDEINGTITGIDDATANVLFIVITESQSKEILIPAVSDFIDDIDNESRTIYFTLPQELLEL